MRYNFKSPRFKWIFLIIGFAIVMMFFIEINKIITQLRKEEQVKIELWANAVSRKAKFVEHTEKFFNTVA